MNYKLSESVFFKKKINIDPDKINYFSSPPNWWWFSRINNRVSNKYLKTILKNFALDRLFYSGNWDVKAGSFYKTDWYLKINDLKINKDNLSSSLWYKLILQEIDSKGFYVHKKKKIKNKKDALFLINYYLELIESLKKKNFIQQTDHDIPKVLIGRHGEIIKSGNGCHRLAIIKSFKIRCEFPVEIIGIHKKFQPKLKSNLNNIYDFIVKSYSLS